MKEFEFRNTVNDQMEQPLVREYKVSKGWAIFIYIMAPVMICLFCWLLTLPFSKNGNLNALWFAGPFALIMIFMIIVGLIDTVKGKFVITSEKVYTITTLSSRELLLSEIKGYRVTDANIEIESNIPGKKKIEVSIHTANTSEIIEWLSSNYPDLDVLKKSDEEQEILNDDTFGWSSSQREERLSDARSAAKIMNWIGGIFGVWMIFYPHPYKYAVIACIVVPLASLAVMQYFNGLIRFFEYRASAYPNLSGGIMLPILALLFRTITSYQISDYSNSWLPILGFAGILTLIVSFRNPEFRLGNPKGYFALLGAFLSLSVYSFDVILQMNCQYDNSEAEVFAVKIIDKRISKGRTTSYYLELTRWGGQRESHEVSVSKSFYNQIEKNETVNILSKRGRLNIPWYVVSKP